MPTVPPPSRAATSGSRPAQPGTPKRGTTVVGPPPARGAFAVLGRFVFRRRWLVLVTTLLFIAALLYAGLSVFDRLKSGGFEDPSSESVRAAEVLAERFGAGGADLVVLVDPVGDVDVDDGAATEAAVSLGERIAAEPGVAEVTSYWSTGSPGLASTDGTSGLLIVEVGGDEEEVEALAEPIITAYEGENDGLEVSFGGPLATGQAFGETIGEDLARAESIAIPISLVLLVLVFGSVVAAFLPVLIAGVAIVGTFLALYLITMVTDVSVFSINLATALGLGLAIDYSLFMVSRFREELATGTSTEDAIARTMQTAGRTVAFSALTVAVSLGALLIFPLYFLRSFGYAGIAVVLIAGAAAMFTLPALLSVLGPRVDKFRDGRAPRADRSGQFFGRVASAVMRRPVIIAAPIAILLAVLAIPFLGVSFGLPDDRSLPADSTARLVGETLRSDYPGGATSLATVVLPRATEEDAAAAAERVSALDGVSLVDTVTGSYSGGELVAPPGPQSVGFAAGDAVYLEVGSAVEPLSPAGEALVGDIRDLELSGAALVGGEAAALVDSKSAIFGLAPVALAIIALTTFVLLFLMTGSVLVPVKAIVLNVLSLGATFGAMVWIFQDGHLSGLLGFTATGTLDTTTPILMFCIAFGLSMDYEVFLLSRIKEAHDLTGNTNLAVVTGLQRTGRIMTAAAAVLAVTFIAFSTSGVTFIKLMGVGLTLAILLDATIVRALLVPAFMRLAGEANWWAPAPLRRLHQRIGINESG